jgi:hypothetical protein
MALEDRSIWPLFNQRICDALGLNPSEVTAIDILFRPHANPVCNILVKGNEGVMEIVLDFLDQSVERA